MIPAASRHIVRESQKPPRKKRRSKEEIAADETEALTREEGDLKSDLPPEHLTFRNWAISKGVEISPAITPANIFGRGIGIQATEAIAKDTQVIFVPERAIFKPFKFDRDRKTQQWERSAHASLAWAARNILTDSGLQPWSATWPKEKDLRASLPLFFSKELQDLLPPSTKAVLHRQRLDWERDLRECKQEANGVLDYTWMIVNSRSFYWDPPGSKPGYMVLCPFMDYLNHGPEGTGVRVVQTSKGYEVWTNRDYLPGEELLLTYGSHSNDKLLVHYGFVHTTCKRSEPSDDSILLDHVIVRNATRKFESLQLMSDYNEALANTGYLGNYNFSPKTGRVCHRTQVAVRARLCAANEWEYFILNGEDMGRPRWEEVAEWLEECFDTYEKDVVKALEILKNFDKSDGTAEYSVWVVTERWKQIAKALQYRSQLKKGE